MVTGSSILSERLPEKAFAAIVDPEVSRNVINLQSLTQYVPLRFLASQGMLGWNSSTLPTEGNAAVRCKQCMQRVR